MPGFDFDQLRTLVTVADAGSLTAAAPALFLSQSAVSEQIRKLEDRAGQPLLLRGRTGVVPTPAGERLLAHARRILALNDDAYRDLRGVPMEGQLRLAVTDYFRPADIAVLLRRLNQAYPRVRLLVTIMKSGALEQACARGEFDVGLSMRIGTAGAHAGLRVRREPLLWMQAQGRPLTPREPLPLVLLPDDCALHRYALGLLARRGVPCFVAHVASGVAGLQSALAAGLGIACLNEGALAPGVARVSGRALPALPRADFVLQPPRAGESAFVARARDVIAQHFA